MGSEADEGKGQRRQCLSQRTCPQRFPPRGCVGKRGTVMGYLLYAAVLRTLSTAFPEPHLSSVRWGGDVPDCT